MALDQVDGQIVGKTQLYLDDGTAIAVPVSTASPLPTSATSSATTVLNRASSAATATGDSGTLSAAGLSRLAVDVTVTVITGGTAPSITFHVDRLGANGVWYRIWTGTALLAADAQSRSIGPGCETVAVLAGSVRLGWIFGGTVAPTSVTFSASVVGTS